jgi:hypothetical protein
VDAATGGCAGKIEAVFDSDRDAPEIVASIPKLTACRCWHGRSARSFLQRPLGIAPEVGVLAGVPIGVLQRIPNKIRRLDASRGKLSASAANHGGSSGHASILGRNFTESGIGLGDETELGRDSRRWPSEQSTVLVSCRMQWGRRGELKDLDGACVEDGNALP